MTARGIPHSGGRVLGDPRYADDDGSADPALTAALAAASEDPARMPEVLAALHGSRVLAPVVARLGESETGTPAPVRPVRDKSADIAVPVLLADDGSRALPVFTDLAALATWDPEARPVPVTGPVAARVALAEGAAALILDVAGPAPVVLPGPELRALAEGRGIRPAWDDPALATAVGAVLDRVAAARSAHLEPWAGRDARLTVAVSAGVDHADVASRLADAVAALPEVRSGVRGLEVTVVTDR